MIERYRDGSDFEAVASYCRAVRSGPVAGLVPEGTLVEVEPDAWGAE
jgi:hypothetical protein